MNKQQQPRMSAVKALKSILSEKTAFGLSSTL